MSTVYFIQSGGDGGPVKIGVAVDPLRRLAMLQKGSANDLRLLAIISGDAVAEAELHTRFAHLRARGEWFSFSGELVDFVSKLTPYVKAKRAFGPTEMAKLTGWGKPYCSQMLSGDRPITLERAAHVYRVCNVKIGPLINASDADCEVLLRLCPAINTHLHDAPLTRTLSQERH